MPIRQATSVPVPSGEEREQSPIGRSPLGCVATSIDDHIRGCRYYVTFIHDFSRYTWIFCTRMKSEVFRHFQNSKAKLKRQHAAMYNVFGQMEERNISLMHSLHTFAKKEFGENSLADTHRNKTVYPNARIGISSK